MLSHPDVRQVHHIRTRFTGNSLQIDLHVVVDGSMTVYDGHLVAESVKEKIMTHGPDVIDVVVHIEPVEVALPQKAC